MGSFFFFAWAGEYLIYYRGLSKIPGNHHFKEKSKKKVPWAVVYQNDGLRWISPDDRPFIVLTETKPSKRHIPVWARYSPLTMTVAARGPIFCFLFY